MDDFDGDGRQEAYVFAGRPSGDQWYNISVFYVDPNGKITEILKNSGLYGAPQETKSTRDTSFASSCFRYKNQKFVSFWLAPQDGCVYSEVYGAYNGRATKLEIDGSDVRKTPEALYMQRVWMLNMPMSLKTEGLWICSPHRMLISM